MKYVKVKKIENVEAEDIYHLTVKKNRNFFGNDLCLHNCDYYNNPKNEGEIFVKFHNQGDKELIIKAGEAMVQAIFMTYLTTDDDAPETLEERNGGFGSTTKP